VCLAALLVGYSYVQQELTHLCALAKFNMLYVRDEETSMSNAFELQDKFAHI
jgi:hypothetical protein